MIILLIIFSSSEAISIDLPSYSQFCFSIDGKASDTVWGEYVVSGEGDKNVIIRLLDKQLRVKHINPKGSREGKFSIDLHIPESIDLCFTSQDSSKNTISFVFTR